MSSLKCRNVTVTLVILTSVQYLLWLSVNSEVSTTDPDEISASDAASTLTSSSREDGEMMEKKMLETFKQRRDHIQNICQTNRIETKPLKSWDSFKLSLRAEMSKNKSNPMVPSRSR